MKRSGRSVAAASLVIEIEEVLVASSARGCSFAQRSFRILTFRSSFSVAASITRSQVENFAVSVLVVIRASAACRSASVIFCLLTSRSRLLETTDMPRVERGIGDVGHDDGKTGGGAHLRDAVTHGARAYDTDLLDHCR